MIAPHELKNKTFSRTVRGYNPAEVDQYFDFLIEKYTEAYKAAAEFEQKYNEVKAKYAELADEEESIRSAILKAQKLGEAIVNNAKKEASEKEEAMVARCDEIIAEAKAKVEAEKANIAALRSYAIDFQHKLFGEYVKHLETIRTLNLEELEESVKSESEEKAFEAAKDEVLNGRDETLITEAKDASVENETL
jgi:cell division initiation protein